MNNQINAHKIRRSPNTQLLDFRVTTLRYGFAAFCTAVATYIRVGLTPHIEDRIPFGVFYFSVIVVAWVAGTGPAVFALVISMGAAAHYIIAPESSWLIADRSDQIGLIIFCAVGSIAIALHGRLNSQRAVAEREAEKNEGLNKELLQADRRKDEFLSLLSHELRCPLAPMVYAADTLKKIPDDPEQVKKAAQLMGRNLKHLVRLVDDLLDVSRYTRDEMSLRCVEMDLRNCVESAVEMVRAAADLKQHDLFVDVPPQPVMVEADSVRCCQIMCNLLNNAVKFTPPQGRIQVSLNLAADEITFVVEDNGIGIQDPIREQVFEPFFQAHSKRSRFSSGMGLGLAISKKLAELHGGRLNLESEGDGRGSKFCFYLPTTLMKSKKHVVAEDSLESAIMHSMETGNISNSSDSEYLAGKTDPLKDTGTAEPGRILIVDDNQDTANSLGFLLTIEGFETRVVHDGLKALHEYRQFRPHYIVLDIGLPGIDGYETAKRIRLEPCGNDPTIVAVSGWGNRQDRELGIAAGFDAHLVKPISVAELLPKLAARSLTDPIG